MSERTTSITWVNQVTQKSVTRLIPHIYDSDCTIAEKALAIGFVVVLSTYGDIAFTSAYSNRAFRMAEPGETIIYPCGQVVKKLALAD